MYRTDAWRTGALVASAATVIAVPNIGALLPRGGEMTDRYDTSITPPAYAFAVWAPIFASIGAHAVQASLPSRRREADNVETAWPLALSYTLNAAW